MLVLRGSRSFIRRHHAMMPWGFGTFGVLFFLIS
jgi:hypothetical protein